MTFLEDSLRRTARQLFARDGGVVALAELIELGWEELVVEEPAVAISTLAEQQGRRRGTSRIIELEMDRRLGIEPATEALAFNLGQPAAHTTVDAVLIADAARAPTVVVPAPTGPGEPFRLCRVSAGALRATPVDAIDPCAGWRRLSGTVDPDEGELIDAVTWKSAVAAGRRALSHELIGVAGAMLDLAVAHVTDRHQFGVPIGTFQAVQHRLADVHVQAEAARAIARTAWIDSDYAVCAALLAAGRRAVEAATQHCHQVLGALGCTWEHELHWFIRRGILLSLLLDPAADLRAAVETVIPAPPRTDVLT